MVIVWHGLCVVHTVLKLECQSSSAENSGGLAHMGTTSLLLVGKMLGLQACWAMMRTCKPPGAAAVLSTQSSTKKKPTRRASHSCCLPGGTCRQPASALSCCRGLVSAGDVSKQQH